MYEVIALPPLETPLDQVKVTDEVVLKLKTSTKLTGASG